MIYVLHNVDGTVEELSESEAAIRFNVSIEELRRISDGASFLTFETLSVYNEESSRLLQMEFP